MLITRRPNHASLSTTPLILTPHLPPSLSACPSAASPHTPPNPLPSPTHSPRADHAVFIQLVILALGMVAGCEPHVTTVLIVLCVWGLHLRQRATVSSFYGIESPIPAYLYLLPTLVILALSYAQTNSLRAAFLAQKQVVRMGELRIEQLAAEKELLEFERARLASDGASASQPNLPGAGSRLAPISKMENYDSSSCGAEDRACRAESHQGPPVQTGDVIASLGSGSGPVFRPVRPGSNSDDAKTQSSAGSLPFAWPRARPVEMGGADRPACYPIAEITGRRRGTSMRTVIKQSMSTCRRDAIARRPAGPLIGSGHRGHATSLPQKTLALPAADIRN